MGTTFKVIELAQAIKDEVPGAEDYEHPYLEGFEDALVRYDDNYPVEIITVDGGEPEDNCLSRDGDWIAPYLNELWQEAYEEGLYDGKEEGYTEGYTDGSDYGFHEGWEAAKDSL